MAAVQLRPYLSYRTAVLALAKAAFVAVGQPALVHAAPLHASSFVFAKEEGKPPTDPSLWLHLSVAALLVLLGGAFAGLTIALMGQDEIYLQVIKTSGEGAERKHAAKVLNLLGRGKHWVLVTLLLGNVITNETLPIILDRSLGGGWPAVLGSTVLIVIFGEIAPQSVCVRYGLPIGSWMAPFVLALMYILAPVAWPTAKLLDYLLGEDHGTVYKKAGLKTLVSLHKSLGEASQQLNTDEVTIITAVLDLKDKSIGSIMTPMDDVFTLSLDDVLDEETMDILLTQGYSRIPIHHPDNDENFVGMLLVKMLITYDPEDAKPVREFALATLPETSPHTSCLDIVNFFQEGKSHMVLVSDNPGGEYGALGVVTLEDVIEELIGEEIVDESDVYIDVHKAIRRLQPAPRMRIPKPQVVAESPATNGAAGDLVDINEGETLSPKDLQRIKTLEGLPTKTKPSSASHRRRSSATNSNFGDLKAAKRANTEEIREHLKHLGPSNLASRPRTTRYNTVKIKPGSEHASSTYPAVAPDRITPSRRVSENTSIYQSGIGEDLLLSGGKGASDGVQALQKQGYGSVGSNTFERSLSQDKGVQADTSEMRIFYGAHSNEDHSRSRGRGSTTSRKKSRSRSTLGSLRKTNSARSRSPNLMTQGPTRSGSITENIIEANGIRKVVLETTSSSSNEEDDNSGANKGSKKGENKKSNPGQSSQASLRGGVSGTGDVESHDPAAVRKKKRRRRKQGHGKGEAQPLLGDGH